MTVRSQRINNVMVTDEMLTAAIADFARQRGMSRNEAHQVILSNVEGRDSMLSWVEAIGRAATSIKPDVHATRMAQMIDQYVKAFPPDRVYLSADDDSQVGLSAEDAEAEVQSIILRNQRTPRPCLSPIKSAASVPCRTVGMTHEQAVCDDELALTSTTRSQAEVDSYIRHLQRGKHGARAFGTVELSQGSADRTDVVDAKQLYESDVSEQLVPPNQSTELGSFSERAQQQISGLAPAFRSALEGFIAAAQSEEDHEAVGLLEAAEALARQLGLTCLAGELSQRAEALATATASYLNSADEAQEQSAGEMSAAQVAAEVSRLSNLHVREDAGNRVIRGAQ